MPTRRRCPIWAYVRCAAITVGAATSAGRAQTLLYSDDFDSGTSAGQWTPFDTGDASANFAWNYAAYGIPSAPHSAGGTTVGLRFSVNDSAGAPHAISAYPNGAGFGGDYRLTFDMWLNYNGGAGGGSGSTQFSVTGINQAGTQVNWPNNPASDGESFAVSGEGGDARDYRTYRGATESNVTAGVYLAGSQNHTHSFYRAVFPSPPYETLGAPGKRWVTVEIRQQGAVTEWRLNGNLVSTRTDATLTSGTIMLGYFDPYAPIAVPPQDNFVVYDNVCVETLPPPDCNHNGVPDSADLAGGALDCNVNGVLDVCETIDAGNFDADGDVDARDGAALVACLAGPGAAPSATPPACVAACRSAFDFDVDLDVDLRDVGRFQRAFMHSPIPPRPAGALTGSQFMAQVSVLTQSAREQRILEEISAGNIPDFLRTFRRVTVSAVLGGVLRTASYRVMSDYLAVGSNADFVRTPMTPVVAQPLADQFDCLLPTRKMVNDIYFQAPVHLAPYPFSPAAVDITAAAIFFLHDQVIDGQGLGAAQGALIGGIKKDVVITTQLPANPGRVAIYGWHQLNGTPIQPLYLGHAISYVDYSHGIRLVSKTMTVDGVEMPTASVLADPLLSALLSDEGPVTQAHY